MSEHKLTDRERILTTVIREMHATMMLCPEGNMHREGSYTRGDWRTFVHFAHYREPVKGDLVMGNTGRIDQWKIAFYEAKGDPSIAAHVVRDIDTGQLCDYANESFVPIVGLNPIDLLVGDERDFYEKVLAAFARGDEHQYRYGGVRIEGRRATITVRERFGGFGQPSMPFDISMEWTPKTTIKAILQAMRDSGYGTKSFRPEPEGSPV